ncbi:MAG: beta-glucosidase [Candidatus Sumerlaeota bacterium]|nr:beta-glucosidase [Candidatus Sumerlaeota bacterium]
MAFPFQDPGLPIEERLDDLLARLTLDEKIARLMHESPAIERLGIPAFNWWNECLHGVARAGKATVFPQAIGLAAAFNRTLMHEVASVIADEGRAKHHDAVRRGERGMYQGLTFWTPNINIFRDPRWGRGQETYGEDPCLTAELGVAFIRGLQGGDTHYLKAAACAKHYAVHSGPEVGRHSFDARVDERDLHETYLPAFRAAVVDAGVAGVMGAYNRTNGDPCCAHAHLNQTILRAQWGFEGYYVSDVGAIQDIWKNHCWVESVEEACAAAVKATCDLNGGWEYGALKKAVEQGLVDEAAIDASVRRLFRILLRLGLFDPEESVPFAGVPIEVNDCEAHRALAREAARQSLVLLTNDGTLPLDRAALRRIAVIGPVADSLRVLLGNYHGTPSRHVTILDGIRAAVEEGTEVLHDPGCHLAAGTGDPVPVPPYVLRTESGEGAAPGLAAEYFDGHGLAGEPVLRRTDMGIAFNWGDQQPDARSFASPRFSARWSGVLAIPRAGVYRLGVTADAHIRLFLDGELVAAKSPIHGAETKSVAREFKAGDSIPVTVVYDGNTNAASARFVWLPPEEEEERPFASALAAAAQADVVIACLGLTADLEGEEGDSGGIPGFKGGDRLTLDLPGRQGELLDALCATGRPVVAVTTSGSALALGRAADQCAALLHAWYPGEEGGAAIAEALFGDANPGGRLPVTFYRSADDLPPFEDYAMEGRTYRFFRGEPLFPFGHGLSYTRFVYSDLRIGAEAEIGADVPVAVTVANAGGRAGDEVVQLYVEHVEAGVRVPIRSLVGFERVRLEAGEARAVRFVLSARALSVVHPDGRRVVEPGRVRVFAGGGQPTAPGLERGAVVAAEVLLTGKPLDLAL